MDTVTMRKLFAVIIAVSMAVILATYFGVQLLQEKPPQVDTDTHSIEVAGYYGDGAFSGELLQSDAIDTNVTDTGMSQSVVFQGRVCQRVSGLGKVFLDGAKTTEPDVQYKVYVNGLLQFTKTMEVGSSSALSGCFTFAVGEHVMTGQNTGTVRAELVVYVHDFQRGAGAYEVLATDQAVLR